MNKKIIYSTIIVIILIIIFLIIRFTDLTGSKAANPEDLYASHGCATCHGANLEGTVKGPELTGLTKYWSKEELVTYLRNTAAFMDNKRMIKFQNQYKQYIMPSYDTLNVKDVRILADYLLKQ
jgi:mono/diheme cytochrome c family protein